MNGEARIIAFGGVTAALAVTVLCLGTLLPLATYICPMVCALLLFFVLRQCSARIAWAWYAAVALLGALLAPDKEAAGVFVFLGYYPIVKPKLEKLALAYLWKVLLFNAATAALYALLIFALGMGDLAAEFRELGLVMLIILLLLGNATFLLLDVLLTKLGTPGRKRRRHG